MALGFLVRAAALMLTAMALSVFTSIATVHYMAMGRTTSMQKPEARVRIETAGHPHLHRYASRRSGGKSSIDSMSPRSRRNSFHEHWQTEEKQPDNPVQQSSRIENAFQQPFQYKTLPSTWNSSYRLGCDSDYVSRASTLVYKGKTTSGKTCSFRTLQEYTKCRMRKGNGKLFGHFADRLWVNQWRRNDCCGARVPKITHFFAAADRDRVKRCLQEFVAPAPGAVIKFNHKAGDVTGCQSAREQLRLAGENF